MRTNPLKKWLVIGIIEVLISLFLIAMAPHFLNSNLPIIGFLMWFFVLILLSSSAAYGLLKIWQASQARKLFISYFPEYKTLKIWHFIELSPTSIQEKIAIFQTLKNDPDCSQLNFSPLDLLQGAKKR